MATKKKTATRYVARISMKNLVGDPVRTAMALAFDEWMRRYTENPSDFAAEFESVASFKKGRKSNGATQYGNDCADMLGKLMAESVAKRVTVRTRAVRK
jgi:hypothetical protein